MFLVVAWKVKEESKIGQCKRPEKTYRNIWIWRVQPLLPLPPIVLFISNCTYFWLLKKKCTYFWLLKKKCTYFCCTNPYYFCPMIMLTYSFSSLLVYSSESSVVHFVERWIFPVYCNCILQLSFFMHMNNFGICICDEKISGQRDGISLGPRCIILPLSSKRPDIPT
jgi:hypothetical protein